MEPLASSPAAPFDRRAMARVCSRLGFGLLLMIVVSQLVGGVLLWLLQSTAPSLLQNPWVIWLVNEVALYLGGFPFLLLLVYKLPVHPGREGRPFSGVQITAAVFICFAATYLANYVSLAITLLIGLLRGDALDSPMDMVLQSSPFANLVFGVILSPLLEEFIFRGLLLRRLRGYGEGFAIFVSALFFGTFHGNLNQMLYAFVLGLIFAYVTLRTGNLRLSIFLHMLINFVGSIVAVQAIGWGAGALYLMGLWMVCSIAAGITLFCLFRKSIRLYPCELIPLREGQKLALFFKAPGVIFYLLAILVLVLLTIVA